MSEIVNIILDSQIGISRLGGNKTLYLKLLTSFFDSLKEGLPPFKNVLSSQTREEFCREIHSLKGVSGNLSAIALYESCSALDASIKLGKLDEDLYNNIVVVFKETQLEVDRFLKENL
jgi:HPt (histidine-containing phosphotransfer) domain-containing protein